MLGIHSAWPNYCRYSETLFIILLGFLKDLKRNFLIIFRKIFIEKVTPTQFYSRMSHDIGDGDRRKVGATRVVFPYPEGIKDILFNSSCALFL